MHMPLFKVKYNWAALGLRTLLRGPGVAFCDPLQTNPLQTNLNISLLLYKKYAGRCW